MSTIELPYDLKAACRENGIDISDVTKVLLEITGEKDECDWHWKRYNNSKQSKQYTY